MLISNGQVVDGLDVWRLSKVLDRSNEALGAWVEQIPGLPPICQPAKVDRLLVLGRSEAGALTETDQPWVMKLVSSTTIDKTSRRPIRYDGLTCRKGLLDHV